MKCRGCGYWTKGDGCCNFCYWTGEPRGCSAEDCYKQKIHYTTSKKLKQKSVRAGLEPKLSTEALKERKTQGKGVVRKISRTFTHGGRVVVYENATLAAQAAGVSQPTLSLWAKAGETKLDSVWGYA